MLDSWIWFSEEPGFKLLMEGEEWLQRHYLLRQSVPDMGSSNREHPVTDCWTSDRLHHKTTGATRAYLSVGQIGNTNGMYT